MNAIREASVVTAKLHWKNKEVSKVTVIGFWSPTGPFIDVCEGDHQYGPIHCIRRDDVVTVENF